MTRPTETKLPGCADTAPCRMEKVRERTLNPTHKLSYPICSILGLHAASAAAAAESPAENSDAIAEITVTAQRRVENIQDVPITIQALTGETLSELNVATFDDFVKYLPNVSTGTIGPGQGNIYM